MEMDLKALGSIEEQLKQRALDASEVKDGIKTLFDTSGKNAKKISEVKANLDSHVQVADEKEKNDKEKFLEEKKKRETLGKKLETLEGKFSVLDNGLKVRIIWTVVWVFLGTAVILTAIMGAIAGVSKFLGAK